jgi:hypothetical protein
VPGEVLDPDHFRDQKEVDNRPDEENPSCQQPNDACNPPAEIEPVETQDAEPAYEPQKVRDKIALHSNSLGSEAFGFQSKGSLDIDLMP